MSTKITNLNGATMYRSGTITDDGVFVPDSGQVLITTDLSGTPVAGGGGGGSGGGGHGGEVTIATTGNTVKIDPANNTVKIAASQTVGVTGTVAVSGPITNAQALALKQAKVATNRSGTITDGGTSQTLAASNTSRFYLSIQNISSEDLWVSEFGAAAVDGAGSYCIETKERLIIKSSNAVTIVGANTGQAFTASEVNA